MDIEEWENMPENGSLQTQDDGDKMFFTRKLNAGILNSDFNMNYFVLNSSQKSPKLANQKGKQLARTAKIVETDQETVTHENQFVDMKIEYPKFSEVSTYPRISDDVFKVMDIIEADKGGIMEGKTDSQKGSENEIDIVWEKKSEGINIWKKSLSGVGAICSFSIAVAAFCIIILGDHGGNHKLHRHNQKNLFQI